MEAAVEMMKKHSWWSWMDYHYQMWRWWFWWSTLEEYKVWENIVDSDLKQTIIEKINVRIQEENQKRSKVLIEKIDNILLQDE